jgi:hypothetical protein
MLGWRDGEESSHDLSEDLPQRNNEINGRSQFTYAVLVTINIHYYHI